MRRTRRIAVSAAVTSGVIGVAGVAVAAVPDLAPAKPASTGTSASNGQDAAMRLALQTALAQIDGRTKALGSDLTAAQHQLLVARAAATRAAAARAAAAAPAPLYAGRPASTSHSAAPRTVIYVHAAAPKPTAPATHTTTGASGSSGGDDGGSGGQDD